LAVSMKLPPASAKARKRRLQEELDDLRREREREDRRNEASVAAASEQRRENVRRQRADGGSRFNQRYRGGVPASAVTPAAVREALARYVEFQGDEADAPSPGPVSGMRLGLLLQEVEALLGPAVTAEERMEGTLARGGRRRAPEADGLRPVPGRGGGQLGRQPHAAGQAGEARIPAHQAEPGSIERRRIQEGIPTVDRPGQPLHGTFHVTQASPGHGYRGG
jgi:hypothetical protein